MDNRRPLTNRQREALDMINGWIDEHGYPPTHREIGTAMAIRSTNGVGDHLRALEKKGYLQRNRNTSRGLWPIDRDKARPITIDRTLLGNADLGDACPLVG